MKILITGAQGQFGRELAEYLEGRHEVFAFSRADLDVTSSERTREMLEQVRPDAVVHAAAYTAVDMAETDEERAYRVNAFGARNVAAAAEAVGAKVCYISTDYVFDGSGTVPYREYDNTNPINVYGKSKRAGELLVQSLSSRFFIVRTSWVYGKHGNNFVKTMLKLGRERDRLSVVHDQVGSPTYAADLCRFVEELILTDLYGVYHATNTGACSWHEFARAIFEESGMTTEAVPCTTEAFPRPAPRPMYSVMEHLALRAEGLTDLPPWRESLRKFLQEFQGEGR